MPTGVRSLLFGVGLLLAATCSQGGAPADNWVRNLGTYCAAPRICQANSKNKCIEVCDPLATEPKQATLLDLVRQDCAGLRELAWTLHSGGATANNSRSPIDGCAKAVALLRASVDVAPWTRSGSRQRNAILLRCEATLSNCQQQDDRCSDLPLCVAAVENAHCSDLEHCTSWLGKRLNTFQRQEELQARNLLEQVSARRESKEQADKQLRQQEAVALQEEIDSRIDRALWANLMGEYRNQLQTLASAREQFEQALQDQKIAADSTNSATIAEALDEGLGSIAAALRSKTLESVASAESKSVVRQLDPDQPIETLFPAAESIEYGIVVLPHPQVPRHRRSFQSASDSIISGMSDAGYYLAAYYDPWASYDTTKSATALDASQIAADGQFGIRVFRKDLWRPVGLNRGSGITQLDGVSLRVLLQVGETQTYGVQAEALASALRYVVAEVYGAPDTVPSRSHPARLIVPPIIDGRGNIVPLSLAYGACGSPWFFLNDPCGNGTRNVPFRDPARIECVDPRYYRGHPCIQGREPSTTTRSMAANCSNPAELREAISFGTAFASTTFSNLGKLPCRHGANIFVIGPTFSGSIESLRQASSLFQNTLAQRKLVSLRVQQKLRAAAKSLADLETTANKMQPVYATASVGSAETTGDPAAGIGARALRQDIQSIRQCRDSLDQLINHSSTNLAKTSEKFVCTIKFVACSADTTPECTSLNRVKSILEGAYNQIVDWPNPESTVVTVNAVSASATSSSNTLINNRADPAFRQASLATPDDSRASLALDFIKRERSEVKRVAVLYEPTAFGADSLASIAKQANGAFTVVGLSFPPNIADLRQHLRDNDKRNRSALRLLQLSGESNHVPIDEAVENGNEYPEALGSKLAATSAEQRLRLLLDQLKGDDMGYRIDAVIIAAADVRDRLYLFDRLNRDLPAATLVDFGADILLAHPDSLHATRGVAMISSVPLGFASSSTNQPLGCESEPGTPHAVRQFDSDRNALLHVLTRCVGNVSATAELPRLYRIGRHGPELSNEPKIDSKYDLSLRGVTSGLAYPYARASCAAALIVVTVLLAAVLLAPPILPIQPQFQARWWGDRVINLKVFFVNLLLAAGLGLVLLPLYADVLVTDIDDPLFCALRLALLVALISQLAWLRVTRRLKSWTIYADGLVRAGNGGKSLGDWFKLSGQKPRFHSTPIEAAIPSGIATLAIKPLEPATTAQLRLLELGFEDSIPLRNAMRALLERGLKAIGLLALATFVACGATLVSAWLYPIPGRGQLLLASLVLMVSASNMLVSNAIAFERSAILSRLFCGTDSGLQVSGKFITALLGPIALLIVGIIAADQPGIMDAAGGLLKWLANR